MPTSHCSAQAETPTSTCSPQSNVIAAFDFDGTITTRDTLLPFLIYTTGYLKTCYKLAKLSPILIKYLINLNSRQQTKEIVLTEFFKGMPLGEFERLGAAFADSAILKKMIKKKAYERIKWHQKQNHRCILISASIDTYLLPWSKKAGFDDLLCSQVESTPEGIVTGLLKGSNCWGPEKMRRLDELIKEKNYVLYAYGDSRGDQELLESADYAFYRTF